MEIKRENFFVVQGFMIKDLNLKGNELLVYAIIYGFSQSENQYFTGSINYLSSWTGISSRTTIFKILNSLIEKGLIKKEEEYRNNVKFCKYKTVVKNINNKLQNRTTDTKNKLGGIENELDSTGNKLGVIQNMYGGSTENEPNNIDIIYKDNIANNKENNIYKEKYKKEKSTFVSQKHLRLSKKINFQETLRKKYKKEKNFFFEKKHLKKNINFELENSNNIISYINSLNIRENYKNKLMEFYEYRKIIERPIRNKRVIDSILKQEFENEEHAILCIDCAIGNEYMRVLPEYVNYQKVIEKKKNEKEDSDFSYLDFSKITVDEDIVYPWEDNYSEEENYF